MGIISTVKRWFSNKTDTIQLTEDRKGVGDVREDSGRNR